MSYIISKHNEIINIEILSTMPFERLKNVIGYSFSNLDRIYSDGVTPGRIVIDIFNNIPMYVHKSKLMLVIWYDDKLLAINKMNNEYVYIEGNYIFSSLDMEERKVGKEKVLKYIELLEDVKKKYKNRVYYNELELYADTRTFNKKENRVVIEGENIKLVNYTFRNPNSPSQSLTIINKETEDILGNITFKLSEYNFSYEGNVSYEIYERFRYNHYATEALELVKKLVLEYQENIDKTLYISTLPNNYFSQNVALNCGGELFFEGEVPKNDRVYFIGKIDKVLIYRINL